MINAVWKKTLLEDTKLPSPTLALEYFYNGVPVTLNVLKSLDKRKITIFLYLIE